MMHLLRACAAILVLAGSGLTTVWGSTPGLAAGKASTKDAIVICHGTGCHFKSKLELGSADQRRFAVILSAGGSSPRAERMAISRAIRHYENRAAQVIGRRDDAKSNARQIGKRGQMDCIDESTNTRAFMLYLERRGLLKHHAVSRNATRGFLIDRRYPHSTAVLQEKSGMKWAVDSWYEPTGGAPDIMPLSQWRKRGVMGQR